MDNTRTLIDTSVIIDFLRKQNKEKSHLWSIKTKNVCFMSSITLFELLSGAKTQRHLDDISKIAKWIESIYFDDDVADMAATIYRDLKEKNEIIEHRDIFIAATAKCNNLCIATLNTDHFERVRGLELLDIDKHRNITQGARGLDRL